MLWARICQYYEAEQIHDRLSCLQMNMYVNTSRPHLENPEFNGGNMAKVRALVEFGVSESQMVSRDTDRDRQRIEMMRRLPKSSGQLRDYFII